MTDDFQVGFERQYSASSDDLERCPSDKKAIEGRGTVPAEIPRQLSLFHSIAGQKQRQSSVVFFPYLEIRLGVLAYRADLRGL